MAERVDLFDSTYSHFNDEVLAAIRQLTFGTDIGQNSWTTVDEYDRFATWLGLVPNQMVLEVGCGSGGPALHLAGTTGCRVIGLDHNDSAIATATRLARSSANGTRVRFAAADASETLPLKDNTLDGLLCIDSMNHLPDRRAVLREFQRVLRPGQRAAFTDPVVITGPITSEELAVRSSIGPFLFVPAGYNERVIAETGFLLVHREDVTANAAAVAGRWHQARESYKDELIALEGEERFIGLQHYFSAVHRLTTERRLARIVYVAEKPAD